MQYRLRTLLILLAVGPVVLAVGYSAVNAILQKSDEQSRYYIGDGSNINYRPAATFNLKAAAQAAKQSRIKAVSRSQIESSLP